MVIDFIRLLLRACLGLRRLANYRKKWDQQLGRWS